MTGRIFITGDRHGTFLPLFGLAEKMELRDTDILLIAGDAGYVWNEDYPYAVETLEQVFHGIIAFVDGNHENHALLNQMEIREWMGGKVHLVGQRVFHLMRGEVYTIYGTNFFVFGGARSSDKDRRKEGYSWWREEEPSAEEIACGKEKLLASIDQIDYIITHESPLFAREIISRKKTIEVDYRLPEIFDDWYKRIVQQPRFQKWYFGHMHVDQPITPKLRAIYHDILSIDDEGKMKW